MLTSVNNKFIALILLTSTALAAPQSIFTLLADTTSAHGQKTTFTVDVDLRKTKIKGDETKISLTIRTPQGSIYQLISRCILLGEKVHWQGKIPATGKYTLRVIRASGGMSRRSDMSGPVRVKLTSDAQGHSVLMF